MQKQIIIKGILFLLFITPLAYADSNESLICYIKFGAETYLPITKENIIKNCHNKYIVNKKQMNKFLSKNKILSNKSRFENEGVRMLIRNADIDMFFDHNGVYEETGQFFEIDEKKLLNFIKKETNYKYSKNYITFFHFNNLILPGGTGVAPIPAYVVKRINWDIFLNKETLVSPSNIPLNSKKEFILINNGKHYCIDSGGVLIINKKLFKINKNKLLDFIKYEDVQKNHNDPLFTKEDIPKIKINSLLALCRR